MKINLVKIQDYKLFKYNLLKMQIYSKKTSADSCNLSNVMLEQIEVYLKQVLNIIFKYHINNFKILFIGFPLVSKTKQIKLINFTNHNFISEKSWMSGIFRNRFSVVNYLKLIQSQNFSKNLKLLLKIKTKPHLVVIFSQKLETDAINECYKTGIPILSFNSNFLDIFKVTYKTIGNFEFTQQNMKMIYFFFFYSLLKKTPLHRKVFKQRKFVKTL